MPFLNFMEDIVCTLVDEIIGNDKKYYDDYNNYRDDVIVYVLNRVPPRYYTSERGILHGKLDIRYLIQEKVDLFYIIHEALEVVRTRRKSEITESGPEQQVTNEKIPHIIGEVLEESTLLPVPGMKVTLEYNNKKANMIKKDWKNPFITNINTKGYFHFWPHLNENEIKGKEVIPFNLKFEHEKCVEKNVEISVSVTSGNNIIKSFKVPIVLVEAMDTNIDFLN